MFSNRSYSPVEQLDEEESASEKLLTHWLDPHRQLKLSRYRKFCIQYWAYFTHGILLFMSALFFCLWIRARTQRPEEPVYSPANEAVEYLNSLTTFNGTFNHPSEFRGHPTPEIDAAWMRISQGVKPTRLTLEQVLKVGKKDSPSKVKFRDEDGGGYMASMEVTHQLHCLNMLRKYTYHEYYETFDPSFTEAKPEVFRTHLDHCVEILRQNLMCSADVGMITYEWVKGFSEPYPDFNTKHQCRNFDKILEWGYKQAVHIPRDHVARFGYEIDLTIPP
ncbi:hypothetical protein CPB84DRAFT_1769237 [Gymnopilus junonius]|uniref:Tat pathway signal sequence n=1 Tax=Gymnopilus junonius TaxID=109634 RepID=A0A9P5NXB4_GYMJU|nr:hypothetical protein CPB84DRAFT_1769237 [Gymnopilus junonius]